MNKHDESICLLVGKSDAKTRGVCPRSATEGVTALANQKEGGNADVAGVHWSGQPGEDLFFNNWKLLF